MKCFIVPVQIGMGQKINSDTTLRTARQMNALNLHQTMNMCMVIP